MGITRSEAEFQDGKVMQALDALKNSFYQIDLTISKQSFPFT